VSGELIFPFIQPTEKELKENIITGNERFAQASIHGVDAILLILVIRDRFDKLTTLLHFFLSMLSAESGNQHFQHPAIYFIIGMGHQGIGYLACAKPWNTGNRNTGRNRIPGQIYLTPGTVRIIKSIPVSPVSKFRCIVGAGWRTLSPHLYRHFSGFNSGSALKLNSRCFRACRQFRRVVDKTSSNCAGSANCSFTATLCKS